MHDVAVLERSVLATEEARVFLVHEEAEVGAQPAMLVPQPLRERRMHAGELLERLPQRRGVKGDVARAACEAPVGAV